MNADHFLFTITTDERDDMERALRYFVAQIDYRRNSGGDTQSLSLLRKRIELALNALQPKRAKEFVVHYSKRGMIPEEYRATALFNYATSSCCSEHLYRQRTGKPWRCLGCRGIQENVA